MLTGFYLLCCFMEKKIFYMENIADESYILGIKNDVLSKSIKKIL